MRLLPLFLPVLTLLLAGPARAEAVAISPQSRSCVSAQISPLDSLPSGQILYRITFLNRCDAPRSFFWCAEHPARAIPAAVACPSARGFGSEMRQVIRLRREFQWHLPPDVLVRYQDCPAREVPTADFRCEPLQLAPPRR